MEPPNQKINTNGGQNQNPISSNLLYKQNPPPISNYSMEELIIPYRKRKTDHPNTGAGHLGPPKQNKRTVSKGSEKIESSKKIMRSEDKNTSNSFEAWSPRAMEIMKEAYLASKNDLAMKDQAPIINNFNVSPRETASGKVNALNNINKTPISQHFNDSTRRTEEKKSMFEKSNAQFTAVPLILQPDLESPNVNNLKAGDKYPIGLKFDSSTQRVELVKEQIMEKPNEQLTHMSNPFENVEVIDVEDNLLALENSHPPQNFIPPCDKDIKPSQVITDPQSFKIIVDGTDITSKIKDSRTRDSYYNLCCAHGTVLHSGLMEEINLNDAVFYISQLVTIWNSIKSSNISKTPQKEILYWIKALESSSNLGMNVEFMLSRAKTLLDLKRKAEKAVDTKRDEEAKAEGEALEEEIKAFVEKIKIFEVEIEKRREKKRKIDNERDGIRRKTEEIATLFKLVATSPL